MTRGRTTDDPLHCPTAATAGPRPDLAARLASAQDDAGIDASMLKRRPLLALRRPGIPDRV